MSNLESVRTKCTKGTIIYRVLGVESERFFARLEDLIGLVDEEKFEAVKRDFFGRMKLKDPGNRKGGVIIDESYPVTQFEHYCVVGEES